MNSSSTKHLLRKLNLTLLSNTPLSDELSKLNNALLYIQNILSLSTISSLDIGTTFYIYNNKPYFEYDMNQFLWYHKEDVFEKMGMLGYDVNYDDDVYLIDDIVEAAFKESNPNLKIRKTLSTHMFPLYQPS